MHRHTFGLFTAALLTAVAAPVFAAPRTIVFNEDRRQHYMTSKTYELKYVNAHDLLPYVLGAVKRFDAQSSVQSLDYTAGKKQYLVVSTANALFPYIDEMIAKLDYPSKRIDPAGTVIDGDGITRWVYCPEYRSSEEMNQVVAQTFTGGYGSGASFFDFATNMFYFKSSKSEGEAYLKFLKELDRPVPQLEVKLNVYVISDNAFRELGIDYVSWKNGPGAKVFNAGWSFNDLSISQNIGDLAFDQIFTTGFESLLGPAGGFIIAPNIDATFLRMLAQKGKAWSASSGSLTLVNDPAAAAESFDSAAYRLKFSPQFQNIVKDDDQNSGVDAFDGAEYNFYFSAPIVCFGDDAEKGALTLMGQWYLTVNSLAEVDNLGITSVDSNDFTTNVTLQCGTEKLVAAFDKTVKTEQYNGIPYLGEIPVLKYLVGSESKVDSTFKVFVTLSAKPVILENVPAPTAGKVIDTFAMNNTK